MKGIVEIYKTSDDKQELLYSDSNMSLDNFGKTIADIMTTPPSLSGITGASYVLDTSNYTVQAISFGKASNSFRKNAHTFVGSILNTSSVFIATQLFALARETAAGVSSYTPTVDLPSFPNPADQTLEVDTSTLADPIINLSSVGEVLVSGVGHNLNMIPYRTSGAAVSGSYFFVGCYPEGSGTGGSNFLIVSSYDDVSATGDPAAYCQSGVYNSVFNQASSMDTSGFVRAYHVSAETDPISGVIVSSISDFSSTGEVAYKVLVGSGDLGFSNMYGGITNMGLWTVDLKKALAKGATPPYLFAPVNNPFEYRLLAKKVFSQNLTRILDNGANAGSLNYKDLIVVWRISFL